MTHIMAVSDLDKAEVLNYGIYLPKIYAAVIDQQLGGSVVLRSYVNSATPRFPSGQSYAGQAYKEYEVFSFP